MRSHKVVWQKKGFLALFFGLGMLLVLLGLTAIAEETIPLPDEEQILVFATGTQPDSIDPALEKDAPTTHIIRPTYEGLLRNPTGTTDLEPCLAVSWEVSDDGLSYTFNLRTGVRFHDGDVLDAFAIKDSFDRWMKIGLGASNVLKSVASVEVVDSDTVTFNLSKPYPDFLQALTRLMIVSPAAVKAHEKDGDLAQGWLSDHEAGTGPFKLQRWEKGQVITLVRNDDYWAPWTGPHLKKLLFQFVPEPATQKLLLLRGEVRYADFLSADDANELKENPDFVVYPCPSLSLIYIAMNTNSGPTADVNLRKAIAYAFDYETYSSQIMKGWSVPPNGPLPTGYSENFPDMPRFKRNMEHAREFLAKSAYPEGGIKLTFVYVAGYDRYRQLGELLRSNLAELNIDVALSPQPWATLTKISTTPDMRPDLLEYGYSAEMPSAFSYLYGMYHSDTGHWAQFGYKNAEGDRLLDRAQSMTHVSERAVALQEVQRILINDMPQIFVEERTEWRIFNAQVKGFVYDPAWYLWPNWRDMYLVSK